MRKTYKKIQLLELSKYPRKAIKSIRETVFIINDNYGEKRDIENDLGGYVVIAENIVDIEILKQNNLKVLIKYIDNMKDWFRYRIFIFRLLVGIAKKKKNSIFIILIYYYKI